MPWLPRIHSAGEDLWYFQNRVIPSQRVDVAVRDGRIAGFSALDKGWITHLYAAPDAWGRGAGRTLLRRAQAGHKQLDLWSFQRNAGALAFYARAGFAEVARTDGAENEEQMPDVHLRWRAGG
ncbi:GNAT family N-acetyltransferase [Sulfitobacter sp. HNIBRBA3233]|uniref:GNAT family N-acetyltransferase n=1 Tax=Sulfitobacter marinivivus TaxID=3158558 RepID=UPI0032DF733D